MSIIRKSEAKVMRDLWVDFSDFYRETISTPDARDLSLTTLCVNMAIFLRRDMTEMHRMMIRIDLYASKEYFKDKKMTVEPWWPISDIKSRITVSNLLIRKQVEN